MSKIDSPDLHVYIVWVPLLSGDSLAAANEASARLRGARVRHYWDEGGALGRAAGRALALPVRNGAPGETAFAWDVYLVYGPQATWQRPFPRPEFWMHRLMGIDAQFAQIFEGKALRDKVVALLPVKPDAPRR